MPIGRRLPSNRPLPLVRPRIPDDFFPDTLTPNDNNVTHRNYANLVTGPAAGAAGTGAEGGTGAGGAGSSGIWASPPIEFLVRNPYGRPILTALRLELPEGWRALLKLAEPEPPRHRLLPPRPDVESRRSLQGVDRPFRLDALQKVKVAVTITTPGPAPGKLVIVQERVDGQDRKPMGGLTLSVRPQLPAPESQ